ncbi:MAG: ABC transporter permease subunit [Candidatus Latescibacteria bacterium]|nr:ABC transporter permease subunit [Candidatus Latescibacterota bacterium]
MLFALIRKEIINNVLSFRFMVTLVLFFGLILISIMFLTSDHQTRLRTHEASKSAHRDQILSFKGAEDQDEQFHEILFGGGGVYGDRAPQPLGIFVQGLDKNLPSQVNTSLTNSRKIDENFYRNPLFSLFATPDYGYIVNIVVSLLSLLFVFDTICGEKERGTLKLLLANSVPRDLVLLSKWIGGYLSLAIPFLVALLAGITYVYITGAIELEGETLDRLLWIVLVSMLYVSLFSALGMMISTLTHNASTALLVSLFVWISWILVIPNLAPVIAKITSPVPTTQKIQAEKGAVDRETEIRLQRVSRQMLSYGKKAEDMREKIEQEGGNRKKKLDQFYQDKLNAQIELSKNLSRISPSASFTYATTDLAHTGIGLFTSFKRGYNRFEDEFGTWANEWDDTYHDNDEKYPDENWLQADTLPTFKMHHQRLDDAIEAALMDILLLLVFNVLFFMLSYLFFLRYDVT